MGEKEFNNLDEKGGKCCVVEYECEVVEVGKLFEEKSVEVGGGG